MIGYTITKAEFADELGNSVLLHTIESGMVIVSQRDRPDLWQHLLDSGVTIGPWINPMPARVEEPPPNPGQPVVIDDP